jgi:hypothetical protein
MRHRFASLTIGLALAVVPVTAADAAQRVLGAPDGVTATLSGAELTVRFTPAALVAAKVKPGTSIAVSCRARPAAPTLALGDDDEDEDEDAARTADAAGRIRADGTAQLALKGRRDQALGTLDACDVERLDPGKSKDTLWPTAVAQVALTPAGEVSTDISLHAIALRDVLVAAHGTAGYRPAAELGAGVAPLAGPDDTPAVPGQPGYWTDGARATVATLTAAGRRLVIQDLGGGVLRTNVGAESELVDVVLDETLSSSSTSGGSVSASPEVDPEDDRGASPYTAEQPVDLGDGLRASVRGRRLVVTFTGRSAKAFRAVAGRRVAVVCATRAPRLAYPVAGQEGFGRPATARVPKRGGRITFTMKGKVGDACLVADDGTLLAIAAPTKVGRRWFHDLDAVGALSFSDTPHLAARGAGAYYPTASVLGHSPKSRAVALPTAAAAPPVGRVGVWTDGARHAVVAARSASGRRFFFEDEGDGMLRTNVLGELSGLWLLLAVSDGA